MYERKIQDLKRKNYYLSIEEKKKIKAYVIAHPELSQSKIAEHFGVSRGLISNIQRTPTKYEYYERKISELTNLVNKQHDRIFQLECELRKLTLKK
jgi:predicted XRE-type DNA-binding protein